MIKDNPANNQDNTNYSPSSDLSSSLSQLINSYELAKILRISDPRFRQLRQTIERFIPPLVIGESVKRYRLSDVTQSAIEKIFKKPIKPNFPDQENRTMSFIPRSTLLTRQEVAGLLRISFQTLATWHSRKLYNLPVVKIGRMVRYRLSDLEQWIEQQTQNKEADTSPKSSGK